MQVKGKITRQINVDEQKTCFTIYLYHDKGTSGYPIAWINELALELSEILSGKINAVKVFEITEKHLGKVGRIDSMFTAVRYHDDVKLSNSFINAFKRLIGEFVQMGLIKDFKIKHVKVNPGLYPPDKISEGIVVCEVPVALFEFETV